MIKVEQTQLYPYLRFLDEDDRKREKAESAKRAAENRESSGDKPEISIFEQVLAHYNSISEIPPQLKDLLIRTHGLEKVQAFFDTKS